MLTENNEPNWQEYFGHYGGRMFPFPEIADKYKGQRAIVYGDAACVWDDAYMAGAVRKVGRGSVQKEDYHNIVVNKLGETFPGNIEHWYSNEGNLLAKFVASRRNEYRKEFASQFHTHSCNRGAKFHWPWGGHGTSGLCAILTALALGYDKVIVCGMPLNNTQHNGEPPWRRTNFMNEVPDTATGAANDMWKNAIKRLFKGRVRFMSGRAIKWVQEYDK